MRKEDSRFVFLGNNVAIDFINTELVNRGQLTELLQSDADLLQWAHEAGFKLASSLKPADLSAALELRRALKELCQAKIEGLTPRERAMAIVNDHLANDSTHKVLQFNTSDNEYELVPDDKAQSLTAVSAAVASEGAKLLASPQAGKLKRCSNAACVLIFVDTSRGQKRRWCSMETCGNRAKVAKHYRRQLPGSGGVE